MIAQVSEVLHEIFINFGKLFRVVCPKIYRGGIGLFLPALCGLESSLLHLRGKSCFVMKLAGKTCIVRMDIMMYHFVTKMKVKIQ